ncbi:PIN domain-like protein [Hanseniaspora valbyensis NRRL Y-1626]|uniref:PIN domain-like protein n=1 Tax=Hanseniaspora valbyensis NRRL Y-1626 TaxID=766949 RepID=A0A1B7TC05_9ASCO|nr:PIN domain-like protein [Hanseniaspora valbyensis NRRL Y-1626]
MGVHKLWTILEPSSKPIKLDSLNDQVLAVDASIWLYQFITALKHQKSKQYNGEFTLEENNVFINAHLMGFFRRICKLLHYGIKPIFVFDGEVCELKKNTIRERQQKKEGNRESSKVVARRLLAIELLNKNLKNKQNKKKEGHDNFIEEEDVENIEKKKSNLISTHHKSSEWELPEQKELHYHKDDGRMATLDEYENTINDIEDELQGIDLESVNPASEDFNSLPKSTQYMILYALRTKSRLRMGYSVEQLRAMFPDPQEFSRFQIEMVKRRNFFSQKLLDSTGLHGNSQITKGKVSGSKKMYMLIRTDNGWAMSLDNKDGSSKENAIDITNDEINTLSKIKNEEGSDEEDWEEVDLDIFEKKKKENEAEDYSIKALLDATKRRLIEKSPYGKFKTNDDSNKDIDIKTNDEVIVLSDDNNDTQTYTVSTENYNMARVDLTDRIGEVDEKIEDATSEKVRPSFSAFKNKISNFSSTEDNKSKPNTLTSQNETDSKRKRDIFENEEDDDFEIIKKQRKKNKIVNINLFNKNQCNDKVVELLDSDNDNDDDFEDVNLNVGKNSNQIDISKVTTEPVIDKVNDDNNKRELTNFVSDDIKESIIDISNVIGKHSVVEKKEPEIKSNEESNIEVNESALPNKESKFESKPFEFSEPDILTVEKTSPEQPKKDIKNKTVTFAVTDDNSNEHQAVHSDNSNDSDLEFEDVSIEKDLSKLQSENIEAAQILKPPTEKQPIPKLIESEQSLEDKESNDSITNLETNNNIIIHEKKTSEHPVTTKSKGIFDELDDNIESDSLLNNLDTQTEKITSANTKDLDFATTYDNDDDDFFQLNKEKENSKLVDKKLKKYEFFEDEEMELVDQMNKEEEEYHEFIEPLEKTNIAEEQINKVFIEDGNTKVTDSTPHNDILAYNQLITRYKKLQRDAEEVTPQMTAEVQELLQCFGIPYITAPMEAEAQCAELMKLKIADGIITDDSDVFLFGGSKIYRKMFQEKQFVEFYGLDSIAGTLGLSREQLIEMAFLLGSDYTTGIKGIGPVTAIEILAHFGNLENFRDWYNNGMHNSKIINSEKGFEKNLRRRLLSNDILLSENWPYENVKKEYNSPTVDSDETPFKWGKPDLDQLRILLKNYLGWHQDKSDQVLVPLIQEINKKSKQVKQRKVTDFFPVDYSQNQFFGPSKKMAKAIESLKASKKKQD